MRKAILASLIAVLMAASIGVAQAEKKEDPNGDNNHHGMCTAFFNGKKKGHGDEGSYPGPFQGFLDEAPDGSDDDDGDGDPSDEDEVGGELSDLYDYCSAEDGPGIGGNPDENGRFTTCWTDDDEDPDTHNCDD